MPHEVSIVWLSGALLVHKLQIHTGYSPVDISNIFAEVLKVETFSTSDATFDYTIKFSTHIHRAQKFDMKMNETLDGNCEEILGNERKDGTENVEMETKYTHISDIDKVNNRTNLMLLSMNYIVTMELRSMWRLKWTFVEDSYLHRLLLLILNQINMHLFFI